MALTASRPARLLALALATTAATAAVSSGTAGAAGQAGQAGTRHVIVRSSTSTMAPAARAVQQLGGHVDRSLSIIDAVSATVPTGALAALAASPGVREVTADDAVTLAGTEEPYVATADANSLYSIEQVIGARRLWSAGVTGRGVDVALVDSGVAPVAGIARSLVEGPDLTPESQQAGTAHLDGYGHGTHLAGIIAGHDAAVRSVTTAAGDTRHFLGVAPDSRVVSVKVADAHGNSDVSQVIAGIDWVVQHAHDNGLNIRVLNLSFGTDSKQSYLLDPLAYAAEQAWKHGIVVVVSAGNSGAANGRMTDPAIDPFVLAVGADDSHGTTSINDDTIPSFSSQGDGVRNPDLVAPGVHIQSLRVHGSSVDDSFAATGAIDGRFFRGSGTSQAAAVVSGIAALALQLAPWLSPDQLKGILTQNAAALPVASSQAQGAGLVQLRLLTNPTMVRQAFPASTGRGTLEAARGSSHAVLTTPAGSTTLSGETDIFGKPVDTAALAAAEADGTSWHDGSWNSSSWAGSSWTSSSWASSSWATTGWTSSSWASSSWASSSWASSSWASSSWAEHDWQSRDWS